jgi:hypothetical protein
MPQKGLVDSTGKSDPAAMRVPWSREAAPGVRALDAHRSDARFGHVHVGVACVGCIEAIRSQRPEARDVRQRHHLRVLDAVAQRAPRGCSR